MTQLELFPTEEKWPRRGLRKSQNVNFKWIKRGSGGRIIEGPHEEGLNILHLKRLGVSEAEIGDRLNIYPSVVREGINRVLEAQYIKAMNDCYGPLQW